jgi:hypothetical protein
MSKAIQDNSDLRLMELAKRNPSLGGRELMLEIIERGSMPEENERPQRDIRTALKTPSLDDPAYRTPIEHAEWLGKASQAMRDLYERGAEIKGDVLTIPAEEYELRDDRETPFITTLSYAQERIGDLERAQEFYALALAVSGETSDARMRIAVFKHYYDRITRDERGNRYDQSREAERSEKLERTIEEMRVIATEMAQLETRESVESIEAEKAGELASDEDRSVESFEGKMSVASRNVNLREESLRFPAGLSYETKERIIIKTIPEIDHRLESGVSRDSLFKAIDNTFFHFTAHDLTNHEFEERSKTAAFLKGYIDERLRDPETRALNTSTVFREARATIINSTKPETLGRAATSILRSNQQRSEELRQHRADPNRYLPPDVMPLNVWERNLLFNGRAPDHHTREMRDLRLTYGLSRTERSQRTIDLNEGRIEPSNPLRTMLHELDSRRTSRAVAHFQASILNEQVRAVGNVNLFRLSQQIAPHERAYLFELSEVRKKSLLKSLLDDRTQNSPPTERRPGQLLGREFGRAPTESHSFREYMADMGRIERQLLNETVSKLSGQLRNDLSITEARSLLPETMRDEIRLRARNQAWKSLVPDEVFDRTPLPEAVRISDAISHLQEHLQERASIARRVRNDFVEGKVRPAEERLKDHPATLTTVIEDRKQFVPTPLNSLSQTDTRRMSELDRYAAQTREDVYRGFELLDEMRRDLELKRTERQSHRDEVFLRRDNALSTHVESSMVGRLKFEAALAPALSTSIVGRVQTQQEEGMLDRAVSSFQSAYVNSDHEWQFDSLREALTAEMSQHQVEARDREDWQHQR